MTKRDLSLTKQIQAELCKYLILGGVEYICENITFVYEMDVATITKSGYLSEYEVKISRADFLRDNVKGTGFHNSTGKFARYAIPDEFAAPNYFWYVCPEGLIKLGEIPEYAGLIYYSNGEFTFAKRAVRIHKKPKDLNKALAKIVRLSAERKYLGCSYMVHRNIELKQKKKERVETEKEARMAFEAKFGHLID